MKRPRVAVFGLFGRTNLGNEATLAAFLDGLRHHLPGAEAVCVGPRDSRVSAEHGIELIDMEPLRIRHHFWPYEHRYIARTVSGVLQMATEAFRVHKATRSLRGFNALVIPGTGVLDDFGQGPLDLPSHLLRWCRAAKRAALPIHMLSVGAEPVASAKIRRILGAATALCDYRSFRDLDSRMSAGDYGVHTASDLLFPDLAFSLPPSALPPAPTVRWPPRTVGLGVMGYAGWNQKGPKSERIYQEYLGKLDGFTKWLLDRGHTVRLLTGDTRADRRPLEDLLASNRSLTLAHRLIAEPIATLDDLLRQIAQTDIVVGTRFHNVLLALLLERPAISISYSKKNDALLNEFGLAPYCQPVETFEIGRLIAQFEQLSGSTPNIARIRHQNLTFRAHLTAQYEHIFPQWL